MEEINLTPCQQNALSDIVAWSYNRELLMWTLSGAAGTGKTFVTNEILKHVRQGLVCVSAPTHKAKKVIEGATGLAGFTMQKLLGLQPDTDVENFDINNVKFTPKSKPQIANYQLVIVDEASMINSDLFKLLTDEATEHGTKVLFIGDHIQLPPVGEAISPVFNENAVDGVSILRTPARQDPSNPLSIPLMLLRVDIDPHSINDVVESLETAMSKFGLDFFTELMSKPGRTFKTFINKVNNLYNDKGEGFKTVKSTAEFIEEAYKLFDNFDSDNMDYCKMLAFTNKQLSEYNKLVRRRLLDNPNQEIVEGDIIMSYKTISAYPNPEQILTNSMEYVVTDVESTTSPDGIAVYRSTLIGDNGNSTEIDIVNPEDYDTFNTVHHIALEKAKKNRSKWKAYYGFKNSHLILESLNKKFESRNLPKKDMDYAYGITVHKSQGSTYQHVIVDGDNIRLAYSIGCSIAEKKGELTPAKKIELAKFSLRLLYVALSRASKSAILYI